MKRVLEFLSFEWGRIDMGLWRFFPIGGEMYMNKKLLRKDRIGVFYIPVEWEETNEPTREV